VDPSNGHLLAALEVDSGSGLDVQLIESTDGGTTWSSPVARAVDKVRFARGTTRKSPWCAVESRVIDWVSRSPFAGEFELVIMIEVVTEEMHGVPSAAVPMKM
jgi:hypothetical protein